MGCGDQEMFRNRSSTLRPGSWPVLWLSLPGCVLPQTSTTAYQVWMSGATRAASRILPTAPLTCANVLPLRAVCLGTLVWPSACLFLQSWLWRQDRSSHGCSHCLSLHMEVQGLEEDEKYLLL